MSTRKQASHTATHLFGFLVVFLGVAVIVALFLTNRGMIEIEIVRHYWYVVVMGLGMVLVGAGLTQW